jgi:hypothetical protein
VNPFAAETVSRTFARILEEEPPPLSKLRPESMEGLDRIVATCLRKNPGDRYQSTEDLVADFEQLESELAQRRLRASDRSGHRPAAAFRESRSPQWWWEWHQLAVSCVYVLMIYPAWYVQRWLGQPWGMLFLLAVLASVAAGTSLRLHLRFTVRHSPGELQWRLSRSRRWTRVSDAALATALALGALGIGTAHPEFAMLLVTAATALLVATLVIEPTTERAAFRPERPEK